MISDQGLHLVEQSFLTKDPSLPVWGITSRLTLNTCQPVNGVKVSRSGSVSHVLNRVTSRLTPRLANHSVTYVQCVPRHVWSKTSFSGSGVYLTAFCVKSTFTAGHRATLCNAPCIAEDVLTCALCIGRAVTKKKRPLVKSVTWTAIELMTSHNLQLVSSVVGGGFKS